MTERPSSYLLLSVGLNPPVSAPCFPLCFHQLVCLLSIYSGLVCCCCLFYSYLKFLFALYCPGFLCQATLVPSMFRSPSRTAPAWLPSPAPMFPLQPHQQRLAVACGDPFRRIWLATEHLKSWRTVHLSPGCPQGSPEASSCLVRELCQDSGCG